MVDVIFLFVIAYYFGFSVLHVQADERLVVRLCTLRTHMILLPGGSPPLIRKLIIYMLMIDFHHADVQVLALCSSS